MDRCSHRADAVVARIIEWLFAGRVSAIGVGYAACVLALLGMVLLNFIPGALGFGVLFAMCYGASNGILTIARGTVPAELSARSNRALCSARWRGRIFSPRHWLPLPSLPA